jgi:tryptophan synthase alpha chain
VSVDRLDRAFQAARDDGRAALVGYLTAYDPDSEESFRRLVAACEAGLDVLELGVPFSDPTADGGEIQRAMTRALQARARLPGVLELAERLRGVTEVPIVLFTYANPLVGRPQGVEATIDDVRRSGVDALLVVDLPPEHATSLREAALDASLGWIGLVAPTTTAERLQTITHRARGFVYAVSLTGVTGTPLDPDDPALHVYLQRVRESSANPVAVGFGIQGPAQAARLAPFADGIVVGSDLVKVANEGGAKALAERVGAYRSALQPRS